MGLLESNDCLASRLRALQILIVTLVLGIVVFLAIVLFLRLTGDQASTDTPLLTYVGSALGLILVAASALIPAIMPSAARKRLARKPPAETDDPNVWFPIYQARLIVRAACLETGAIALLMAYLREGHPLGLGLALILMLLLAARLPSLERVERWTQTQRELVEQERLART